MTSIHVVAAGAITSLGHEIERTIASLRSGLDRFRQVPFLGSGGADLVVAPVVGYADGTAAVDRYEALALKAIAPCLEGLSTDDRSRLSVYLGLPRPTRPGVPEALGRDLRRRLADRLELPVGALHVLELGRVSVFAALPQARRELQRGEVSQCIVGGVDVLVNGDSLRGLSDAGLLKEEWDGFIPGEGAAFVRIAATPATGPWGAPAAGILGIGLATDAATGTASDPLVGVGACAALRSAVRDAGLEESAVRFFINDLNGARAAFEDSAMGYIRFSRTPKDDLELWHVASYLGETGAAVGAIELIWACAALDLGFSPADRVMLTASEGEHRAAVLVAGRTSAALGSPRRSIGLAEPALHVSLPAAEHGAHDLRALRLDGEDLHGELLVQNFDELSWLWSLRVRHHGESNSPWADIEAFERRLVTHLDALAWSGSVGRRLASQRLASNDLDEVAAAAMVLLSFPPRDGGTDELFEAMVASPERIGAVAAVLPHMPIPAADALALRMVSSDAPGLIAAGLRSLAAAGRMHVEAARPHLLTDSLAVSAELVHAAGSSGLTALWPDIHALVQSNRSASLVGVTRVAYLGLAPPGDLDTAAIRRLLVHDMPVAAALMCLREDVSFCDLVEGAGSWNAATLDAAGWSGELAALPMLLRAAASDDEATSSSAVSALRRISGLVPGEVATGEREVASSAAADESAANSNAPGENRVWAVAFRRAEARWPGSRRFRHGRPWSRRSALEHLMRPECAFAERLIANWEHALVNRAPIPCHPASFVARQREALAALAVSPPPWRAF